MEQKIQVFRGVTVYVPGTILNQSQVIILFSSGAGLEVIEGSGQISARVYLPQTFMNLTRGLLGNWSGDQTDDFTLPNGNIGARPTSSQQEIFTNFGYYWRVTDAEDAAGQVGKSILFHEYDRNSASYYNASFIPDFDPVLPDTAYLTMDQVSRLCGASQSCIYDYITTRNREFAAQTLNTEDGLLNMKAMQRVISCGVLYTPKNGRKSTNKYVVGTKVKFDCDVGYVRLGEEVRECFSSGYWSWPNYGVTRCIREDKYYDRQAGLVAGIVIAVLVIVVIIIACIFCIYRHQQENEDISVPAYKTGDSKPIQLTHLTAPEQPELKRSEDDGQ
jgi:hypothetical protein